MLVALLASISSRETIKALDSFRAMAYKTNDVASEANVAAASRIGSGYCFTAVGSAVSVEMTKCGRR